MARFDYFTQEMHQVFFPPTHISQNNRAFSLVDEQHLPDSDGCIFFLPVSATMYVVASVTYRVCSHGEHMGISVQRATTNVCLPGTAPI